VDYSKLLAAGLKALKAAGFRPDYLEIRQADTLQTATADDQHLVILVAAFIGSTRLIDNIAFTRTLTT
jgi:pantoate--beta-alanine ligase